MSQASAVSPSTTSTDTPSVVKRLFRSQNFMTNLIMLGVVLLLLGMVVIIAKGIQRLPNAPIYIEQTGLNKAQYRMLKQQLGNQATGNFLQADLQNYIDKLQKIGWVDQVDIRRDWKQGLQVKVVPRQAVAKFGSERLVDANGVVFTPADTTDLQAHYWMQLQGENQNATVMMQQVKQISDWFIPLGLKVEEVIVTPRMTWLFRFDNGLRILVDNENTSEKLYRLSVMLQNQLHSQLPKIQTIDLRYKNGMAITWRATLESGVTDDDNSSNVTTRSPTKATHNTTADNGKAKVMNETAIIMNQRITNPKATAITTP